LPYVPKGREGLACSLVASGAGRAGGKKGKDAAPQQ